MSDGAVVRQSYDMANCILNAWWSDVSKDWCVDKLVFQDWHVKFSLFGELTKGSKQCLEDSDCRIYNNLIYINMQASLLYNLSYKQNAKLDFLVLHLHSCRLNNNISIIHIIVSLSDRIIIIFIIVYCLHRSLILYIILYWRISVRVSLKVIRWAANSLCIAATGTVSTKCNLKIQCHLFNKLLINYLFDDLLYV